MGACIHPFMKRDHSVSHLLVPKIWRLARLKAPLLVDLKINPFFFTVAGSNLGFVVWIHAVAIFSFAENFVIDHIFAWSLVGSHFSSFQSPLSALILHWDFPRFLGFAPLANCKTVNKIRGSKKNEDPQKLAGAFKCINRQTDVSYTKRVLLWHSLINL